MLQLVILAGSWQQRRAALRPFVRGCARGRRLWPGAVRSHVRVVNVGPHACTRGHPRVGTF